jgi:hypothetical protein
MDYGDDRDYRDLLQGANQRNFSDRKENGKKQKLNARDVYNEQGGIGEKKAKNSSISVPSCRKIDKNDRANEVAFDIGYKAEDGVKHAEFLKSENHVDSSYDIFIGTGSRDAGKYFVADKNKSPESFKEVPKRR